jgi:DNA-binding NarL/FixJ family response regulator
MQVSGAPLPSTACVRVAIVNDYEVIVAGVRNMLLPYQDWVDVVELDVRTNPDHAVDVALFDTYGQPALGLERIRSLAANRRIGAVAVYTWSATPATRKAALEAGARGIIAKALPAADLVEAIQAVTAGRPVDTGRFGVASHGTWPGSQWALTPRESETLALLTTGMGNRAMAEALFVSENTIRTHLKAVFKKLGVTSRSQAVARALNDSAFVIALRGAP